MLTEKSGEHMKEVLISSFFLCFTFFIFGPTELYITNVSEFWFTLADVFLPSMLLGLLAFLFFSVIGLILPNKWREAYASLLGGIALALYIQGNFIQIGYGLMDGRAIPWSEYRNVGILNTLFWIACILVPFAVRLFLRKKGKGVLLGISCFVILVEAITMLALVVSLTFSEHPTDEMYLSNRNLYTVSKNKNVVIFILDCFDQGSYLDQIISEDPQILDPLDGFVCYENATCVYPRTDASLPYILTGEYYKNEKPYKDYILDSYQKTDYYKDLKAADYDVGIYTYDRYVSDEAKANFIDNAEIGGVKVRSHFGLEGAMLKFTAFRYFPHIAKKYVWFYSGIFDQFKEDKEAAAAFPTGDNNLNFYYGLKEAGLSFTNKGNAYRFIHLFGTHFPYTLNSDLTVVGEDRATVVTQGKAVLNIVYEYLDQLKKIGAYDDTMVIITSDHGWEGGYHTKSPIFFAKGFNQRGPYVISSAPISHTNLQATVMQELGLNGNYQYGRSIYDISEDAAVDRPYLWFEWDGSGGDSYLPDMTEYMVDEEKHYYQTGKIYTSGGEETYGHYKILFEKIYSFSDERGGTNYFTQGVSYIEPDGAWSLGQTGQMIFEVGECNASLNFSFKLSRIYNLSQKLIVKSNGSILYDETLSSPDEPVSFMIPTDYIQNGVVTLDLEYPDAVSPLSLGESEDSRNIAFKFEYFQVHEAGTM